MSGSQTGGRLRTGSLAEARMLQQGVGNGGEVTTERELSDAAQWKLIQKNTFTRWTNEQLKVVNKHLTVLETDLSDGLRMIALVEVLSGKRFHKYNKRPTFRTHKLENVTMALKFLQYEEGIKIVNIVWEDDEYLANQNAALTPKQRLLAWIQNKIPDRPITNFTSDWHDGKAIGALVDAIAPGLCPDWEDWSESDPVTNATEAMNAANRWLDIPQLIEPAEMCNSKVDELSIMTYLSQFPNAKLKSGAPLRPRTNPKRVRVYGSGIEPNGNSVGAPGRFTVETFSAGRSNLEITVVNPDKIIEPAECSFNNDRLLTYSCQYTPTMEGQYQIKIKFAGRDIPKSPYLVAVKGMAGDATKVTVFGPGVEPIGVVVKKKTTFQVSTKNAGMGVVDVVVVDPDGDTHTVRPLVKQFSDELWNVSYTASLCGTHSVNVFFAGKLVPLSPFIVSVASAVDASRCVVRGRGIQPTGLRVGEQTEFTVQTADAGDAELDVLLISPDGSSEKIVGIQSPTDASTYICRYVTSVPGLHVLSVKYGGQPVPKSPFHVDVKINRPCLVVAYGPGLERTIVGHAARFTVETNGERGILGFSIAGQSQAKIDCRDNEDGSADVSYFPTSPGEYVVHVLCDDEDINNSPFIVQVVPDDGRFNPTKVIARGAGLAPTGVVVNEETEFTVLTAGAGAGGLLEVTMLDVDQNPVDVHVCKQPDGQTYICRYTPTRNTKHTISIAYADIAIPSSPFRVLVEEAFRPDKVIVSGPAIDEDIIVNQPTYFVVDCTDAGPGDVAIALTDECGQDIPVNTSDNSDNTFTVAFTAATVGTYTANVYFADQEIPISPIRIKILPLPQSENDYRALERNNMELLAGSGDASENAALLGQHLDPESELGSDDLLQKGRGVGMLGKGGQVGGGSGREGGGNLVNLESDEGIGNNLLGSLEQQVQGHVPVNANDTFDGWTNAQDANANTSPSGFGKNSNGTTLDSFPGSENTADDHLIGNGYGLEHGGNGGLEHGGNGKSHTVSNGNVPGDNDDGDSLIVEDDPYSTKQGRKTRGGGGRGEGDLNGEGSGGDPDQSNGRALGATQAAGYNQTGEAGGLMDDRSDNLYSSDSSRLGHGAEESDGRGATLLHGDGGQSAQGSEGSWNVAGPGTEGGKHLDDSANAEERLVNGNRRVNGEGNEVGEDEVISYVPVDFYVPIGPIFSFVTAEVVSPSGEVSRPLVTNNHNGTIWVRYQPIEPGSHRLTVLYNGSPLQGSPIEFNVNEITGGHVTASGSGLSHGVAGKPCHFTVNTMDTPADGGGVTVAVEGPSKVELQVIDKESSCHVTYLPTSPGLYVINVKLADRHIDGSPFTAKIFSHDDPKARPVGDHFISVFKHDRQQMMSIKPKSKNPSVVFSGSSTDRLDASRVRAYGKGLCEGRRNEICEFSVDTKDTGCGELNVVVEGPSNTGVQYLNVVDAEYRCVYTPTKLGCYVINIRYGGEHVPGSPFLVMVGGESDEQFPPITDKNISEVMNIGAQCQLRLNIPGTECDNLAATVLSPGGVTLSCHVVDLERTSDDPTSSSTSYSPADRRTKNVRDDFITRRRSYGIRFIPTQIGVYTVSVSRGSRPIPGNPFRFIVGPTVNGNGPLKSATSTSMELGGPLLTLDSSAAVPTTWTSPIIPAGDGLNKRGRPENVEGSDGVRCGAAEEGVHVSGPGLEGGEVNAPGVFSIRSVDKGCLSVVMEGPSKAAIDITDSRTGSCDVKYICTKPGDYLVHVKFNDQHIANSPFAVQIQSNTSANSSGMAQTKKHAASYQALNKPATLVVNVPAMHAPLNASVVSPTGVRSQAVVQERDEGVTASQNLPFCDAVTDPYRPYTLQYMPSDKYAIRFIPRENGRYELFVRRSDGQQITGSPYRLTVGKPEARAALVEVLGDTLRAGRTGVNNTFKVDNRRAGPADILVTIEGRSNVSVEAQETKDLPGLYEIRYRTNAPGSYQISVKYGGAGVHHVPGSPFTAVITGDGTPTKWNETAKVVLRGISDDRESASGLDHVRLIRGSESIPTVDNDTGLVAEHVACMGAGLQKAFVAHHACFTVDTTLADGDENSMLLVGVLSPRGPCEDVHVTRTQPGHAIYESANQGDHSGQGRGQFTVTYRPVHRGNHAIVILWGDRPVNGSPFHVIVQ